MSRNLPPVPPQPPGPPAPLNYATPSAPSGRSDLRTIAIRQKAIQFCILGEIVVIALTFAAPAELILMARLGLAAAMITAAVFAVMLAMAVYDNAGGIVLGVLTLIPYLGLIFLLIVNGKATSILREHKIHVGLLGANLSQIPSPGQTPY